MIRPRLEVHFPPSKWLRYITAKDEYSPYHNEFLFNHNRSAILFVLELLGLMGKNVAILGYNCHTVMNAVHQAGCTPIFIDVDRSLKMDIDDLQHKSQKYSFSAIIVTHLFGIFNDIDSIRKAVNVPIIEDCAHAYLSPECGEKGDFAIFSIGQGKFPSIGDGGICIVNNSHYTDNFRALYSKIPEYSSTERISLFLRMVAKDFYYKPYIYSVLKSFNHNRRANALGYVQIKKMDKGISSLYNESIQDLPTIRNNRQNNTEKTICDLSNIDAIPLINPMATNCFMLPVNCKDTTVVQQYFSIRGIDTATHFKHCIDWAKRFGYHEGDCPNAEYFTKHLLVIPTYKNFQ